MNEQELLREIDSLKRELAKARLKLTERGLIERAKGMRMKRYGLDEEMAYHWLRRTAMNRAERLAKVAQELTDGASESAHAPLACAPAPAARLKPVA